MVPSKNGLTHFLLLDSLRDNLLTQESRASTIEAALSAASESLDRAKTSYDQREVERRRVKEAVEKNGDPTKAGELANQLKGVELEAKVAKQTVSLRHAELGNAKSMQQVHDIHLTLLQETLALMEKDVVFSEDDLHSVLVDIEKQETELKQDLQAAELSLEYFDRQWAGTRQKLDTVPAEHPGAARRRESQQTGPGSATAANHADAEATGAAWTITPSVATTLRDCFGEDRSVRIAGLEKGE